MTNPPPNASTANSVASFDTVAFDRSSGAASPPRVSSPGDSPRASHRQIAAPSGNRRNQTRPVGAPLHTPWTKAGPPASRAPAAPARKATALYRPNTCTRVAAGACPIIACSRVVSGPFSFASVDITPSRASTTSTQNASVSA